MVLLLPYHPPNLYRPYLSGGLPAGPLFFDQAPVPLFYCSVSAAFLWIFSSGTHLVSGDQVTSIGICSGENGGSPHAGCSGVLFAVVDTSDVTLSGTESVTITYTFDISSAGT